MSISQLLCEVRDRDFGGSQKLMAGTWGIYQSTLSRWLAAARVPDPAWYDFLAAKLGLSLMEVHELCQAERAKAGRDVRARRNVMGVSGR